MTGFLDDHVPVRAHMPLPAGITMRGLYVGQGRLALEVLVLDARGGTREGVVRQVWKEGPRLRAAPLLVVALCGETALVCGPAGENLRVRRIPAEQARRLCV